MDFVDDYLFEGPHLLIAEDGSVEGPHGAPLLQLVGGQFWVNNHAHVLTCDSPSDLRYLYYALSTIPIRPYLTGSVQAKLSQGNMNRVLVPYPERSTRERIASTLGAFDDKIESNRKMSETLEAMARALFKSWFVDFDPVHAKAEGRDTGLSPEVAALFPDSFENSELGKIPKGWLVERVDAIAEANRNAINPSDKPHEILRHYSIPAFDEGRLPVVEAASLIKSNKFLVQPESVLLSRLNPRTPRVWMPQLDGSLRSVCSTEFAVLCPRTVSREWLYGLCSADSFCDKFATMVTGTSGSHQRVKPASLAAMEIVLPPSPLIKRYTQIGAPLLLRAATCVTESRKLACLRDSLLPKLISGEIRVREAEKLVEQAV